MTLLHRFRRGTSMIELLVVIVIFLIGILAVLQVFPKGLQILGTTRSTSMATAMARAEADRLRGRQETLPEMILPVIYSENLGVITISSDTNRLPGDLGPYTNRFTQSGNILDASGNSLGRWPYLSGLNNTRRVIGEGGAVPAPRRVGAQLGGLMILQFAPVIFNPTYQGLFNVYGNDLVRRGGQPSGRSQSFEFFVENDDDPSAALWLWSDATVALSYRLTFTAIINNGTRTIHRNIVDTVVNPVGPAGGFLTFNFAAYAGLQGGETFVGVEYDSVRVARNFVEVPLATPFTTDPYEYKLLDSTLGLILFNPAGYNYQIPVGRGRRTALTARVNYDVFDWRVLREEFRVAEAYPAEIKLRLQNLMFRGKPMADNLSFPGLNVFVNDETGTGNTENRDFVLMDMATGGIFSKASLQINYSGGFVTLIDLDGNPANGVQVNVYMPGENGPTVVNAIGRSVRALYMAAGEWAVQVTKAASSYRQDYDIPGPAGFYAGGSQMYYNGVDLRAGESYARIYFPPMDTGRKVTVSEIWYDVVGGGEPKRISNQDFLITNSPPDAAVGLPYIDLRTIDPNAVAINYARYGYGVRGVKGASVNVTVVWNPSSFNLVNDEAANLTAFERWLRDYRRSSSEIYLQKEVQN